MLVLRPRVAALCAALLVPLFVHAQAAAPKAATAPKGAESAPRPAAPASASAAALKPAAARTSTDPKPVTPQQVRMRECNAAAKGKKGDERRTFMSECLRKKKS